MHTLLTTTVTFFVTASMASGALITGTIGFGGAWQPTDEFGAPTTVANAKGVDIIGDPFLGVSDNEAQVIRKTGDFATITPATATYNDFIFDPANLPIDPIWEFSAIGLPVFTFQLDLSTLTILVPPSANGFLLSGSGTLSTDNPAFDPTPYEWLFSANSFGGFNSTFSDLAISAVPEPGIWIGTISLGVLSLVAWRRIQTRDRR